MVKGVSAGGHRLQGSAKSAIERPRAEHRPVPDADRVHASAAQQRASAADPQHVPRRPEGSKRLRTEVFRRPVSRCCVSGAHRVTAAGPAAPAIALVRRPTASEPVPLARSSTADLLDADDYRMRHNMASTVSRYLPRPAS